MPDNSSESYEHDAYAGGSGGVGAKKIIAAGFLIVVLVVAAVLFIINRGGDESSTSPESPQVPTGDGQSVADNYQWAHKEADYFGHMVYAAEDRRGQILSTTTRDYGDPNSTAAKNSRADGVVFQATDFSMRMPIPFSTTDGPTGFDGYLPVGYTQSAAGASLAAMGYLSQISTPDHYAEYIQKATVDPTTGDIAKAQEVADQGSQYRRENVNDKQVLGWANRAYQVITYDGDYARITMFMQDRKDGTMALTADLRWIDGIWKADTVSEPTMVDSIPQEASIWR